MAYTEFAKGSPFAVKRWSDGLMRETLGKLSVKGLIGKGADACIQIVGDLDKNPGDTVYFDLQAQDRSPGVNGDSRLEGFETPLTFFQDSVVINQKRHGHAFLGMSQQRTVHDLREAAKFSLSNWWSWFIESSIFAHICGNTGTGAENVSAALGITGTGTDVFGNTITAADAGHLVNPGAAFAIEIVDDMIAKAKVANPRVAPINVDGNETWVLYLHPYQTRSMRRGSTTWNTLQQYAGVRGMENPIFNGALGMYNNVIIRESEFMPRTDATNLNYAVLMGQGAGAVAFGNAWNKNSRAAGGGGSFFSWKEQERDYENEQGVGSGSILGFKAPTFNSQRFGCVVATTTEAGPT